MFCSITSTAISGVDALPVCVEADVSEGMPVFNIIGSLSQRTKEAADRVKTAMRNLGIVLPPKRITINLSPGDVKKDGTRYDLPIAGCQVELNTGLDLFDLELTHGFLLPRPRHPF